MATHADRRSRRVSGIYLFLNRFMIALSVCVGLAIFFLILRPEIEHHREEKNRLRRLRIEIENQRIILDRARNELELLKTDPEYVEIKARDKMDLMKEGETIFRLDQGAPIAQPPPR